jgi:16S rRNA (cytosine967-C5)-methyltransferase
VGLSSQQHKGIPGLALRQRSATRLSEVLAGGDFSPFTAGEMADGRDRALANKLVTTALRHHGHINAAMGRLLERGPPRHAGSFEAHLRLGLAQLLYLPDVGEHSAIHLAVEGTKRDFRARRYGPLMNAALRRAQAEAEALRALPREMLLPRQLQDRWARDWGAETVESAVDNLLSGAALDLTLRDDDPELIATLDARRVMADTVRIEDRDAPVSGLPGYDEGRWWVQDVAAAIPARLLSVSARSRVLDLCAAPGGKTAQLIKAGHKVTALDNNGARLERLRANLDRLGYVADVVEVDAATWRPPQGFDGVLLDAPCSATGTFRRHPEVLWHRGAARIANRVELQRTLLTNATICLNPGGVLIYCVCSLERQEGEEQLKWIAQALPELAADPIRSDELPGLEDAVVPPGIVRTHPGLAVPGDKRGSLDGFFVARFRRR